MSLKIFLVMKSRMELIKIMKMIYIYLLARYNLKKMKLNIMSRQESLKKRNNNINLINLLDDDEDYDNIFNVYKKPVKNDKKLKIELTDFYNSKWRFDS